jgi:hypothetical protein
MGSNFFTLKVDLTTGEPRTRCEPEKPPPLCGSSQRGFFHGLTSLRRYRAIPTSTIVLSFPGRSLLHDAEVTNASINSKRSLIELAIKAIMEVPFVFWPKSYILLASRIIEANPR